MTSASMVAMPIRSALPPPMAAVAFPATAGDRRRSARLIIRPAAACGDDQAPSMAAVPASLRAIQAKRKLAAAAATSATECAVAALVRAVGTVHGAAAGGARGAGDAVAWVVSKVHDFQASSPDLAVSGLLGMLTSCLGTAVEVEAERARVMTTMAQAKKPDDEQGEEGDETDFDDGSDDDPEVVADEDLPQLVETDMEKELWARIGIMHGNPLHGAGGDNDEEMFEGLDEDEIQEINGARARRRKAAYERVITAGGANSLILSNYAQLLYEFDKDIKWAEMYFKQAVATEPADGEAMRRYAIFLWHVRGDMTKAEDMFTNAIDEEPESSHIRSSYAWFLWMTGGVETCLIDNSKNNGGDDAE